MAYSNRFIRTLRLIGEENFNKLQNSTVTVIGAGAVGSYALECLARSGVGKIRIFDFDKITSSNINRQLYALSSTIGKEKVEVAKTRIFDINPDCCVETYPILASKDNFDLLFDNSGIIADAADSVKEKIDILEEVYKRKIPIVSSMGAALRKDVSKVKIGDLFDTKEDPLAKKIRYELKRRGIKGKGITVIWSDEKVDFNFIDAKIDPEAEENSANGKKRMVLGSMTPVTSTFGIFLASEVISKILEL